MAVTAAFCTSIGAQAAERWTPAWTASQWQAVGQQEVVVANATISFTVRVGAGGGKLRLQLSNEYGEAFRIGAASVRGPDGKTVAVTFGGQTSTTVAARTVLASDAAQLKVRPFDLVEVSLFLPETVSLNAIHGAGGAETSISAPGDFTAAPFTAVRRSDNRPLLARVEVLDKTAQPVVVAFGDSITDNMECANDARPICRWSDVLARRLDQAGMPHVVVTQAIAGNRVISAGTGPSALDRFERDVLALDGVSHVVLLEGINDIRASGRVRPDGVKLPTITAEQLIDGYRQLIARAHGAGIRVIGLTLLPYEGSSAYTEEGDAMRGRVNDWIRTSGAFDAVFDMEKVLADPGSPRRLDPAMHRGDGLHPNAPGETRMGEATPLALFR